jgi:DNA polymerase-1
MEFLNREATSMMDIAGSGDRAVPLAEIPAEKLGFYACECADRVRRLSPVLLETGIAGGRVGRSLPQGGNAPGLPFWRPWNAKGVLLDAGLLKRMSAELGELMALSEQKIRILAGEPFNINSPKQLQEILFVKLKLPRGRKIKTGHSTDVDVLTWLAQSYELPAEILAYRSLMKLKSTYVDALPLMVNPETGRLHTSFNQTATATGRLSSSNPNLQNIPVRTLEGKRIRQAFVASPGHVLLSADYSQIELRILAHLSGDETLIRTFERGEDIHRRTAADVFGVFPELVNEDMRRHAKVINFGILYGMSPFGLSRELGVDQKLAKAYIDEYFRRYKGVRAYIDGILENARKEGFVTTLLNRRRYLPELAGRNGPVRQFAERTAVNTPIQATAADLIKVAMINIWNLLRKKSLSGSMILQVHDELVFEVPEGEREETAALVRKEMEEVIALKVPLKVEIHAGRNWDEAH